MASCKEILEDAEFHKWFIESITDTKMLEEMYRIYLAGVSAGQMRIIQLFNKGQNNEK